MHSYQCITNILFCKRFPAKEDCKRAHREQNTTVPCLPLSQKYMRTDTYNKKIHAYRYIKTNICGSIYNQYCVVQMISCKRRLQKNTQRINHMPHAYRYFGVFSCKRTLQKKTARECFLLQKNTEFFCKKNILVCKRTPKICSFLVFQE